MSDVLLLYISAAADLDLEREVLNRSITEIPTTLAWRIVLTPLTAEEPDLKAIADADVHLLLLGSDVRAPVGVEWLAARRAGHMPAMFLSASVVHTQAAQAFAHELGRYAEWHRYIDVADLRRQVLQHLTQHILSNRKHYNLGDDEYDTLNIWRKELAGKKRDKVDKTRGGAGDSGIILSAERYIPSDGVLLHNPVED
jgi:hypothetical protein